MTFSKLGFHCTESFKKIWKVSHDINYLKRFLHLCVDIIKCLSDAEHNYNPNQTVVNEALRLKMTL